MDVFAELEEIGRLIDDANTIRVVRESVARLKAEGAIVTDGKHCPGADGYEVVVKCDGCHELMARRMRTNMPEYDIQRIAKNVIGVNTARRGSM